MTKIIQSSPYACNICKKRRDNDTNHWFVFIPLVITGGQKGISVSEWSEAYAAAEGAGHACGHQDAQALFARWLATKSLEDVPPKNSQNKEA